MARSPESTAALMAELRITAEQSPTMAAALGEVQALLDRPDELERSARSVVERLALLLQASLLVRHAPPEVADAFVESRLGPGGGLAFGTLSPAADAEAIVRRALPLAT